MAWLSVGETNEDLCDKLVENGVLQPGDILNAFRCTDRGDFVQQDIRSLAYADRPFKHEHVHISAPHMYATVLEQLEFSEGLSFLNIGSGSGYFSCLAACLLGESGLSHGIDVNAAAVEHSAQCCKRWYNNIITKREAGEINLPTISKEGVSFVQGNCFDIDIAASIACCRYDRIYIGAGCPENKKEFFFALLADDGVMIAPIDDSNCLVKIRRQCRNVYTVTHISHVHFAPLLGPTTSAISALWGDRSTPRQLVRLPPVLWAPVSSRHKQFPSQFKEAVHVLLLASRYSRNSIISSKNAHLIVYDGSAKDCNNSLSKRLYRSFPLHVWTYILSFASRDWFVPTQSEIELLSQELSFERKLRAEAEEKLKEAVVARVKAEREMDIYKLVLHQINQGQDVAAAMRDAEEMEEIGNDLLEEEEDDEGMFEDDEDEEEEEGSDMEIEEGVEDDEEYDDEYDYDYMQVHGPPISVEAWHLAGQGDEGEEETFWESTSISAEDTGLAVNTGGVDGGVGAGAESGLSDFRVLEFQFLQRTA